MDSFEDEEDKDFNRVSFDAEPVSFAGWRRTFYDRDQLKDDIMDELVEDEEEENGEPENRTKKKLNKQVIIFELKCPQTDCILSFKSLEQLYQHQESAHGIMAYSCLASGCSEQYNISAHLRQHYSKVHRHHSKWTCPHCDVIRNNSTSLRKHIRDFHQFGRFGCWYDGCSFEADLRIKIQRHRFKAHPQLICLINGCGKGFYHESKLKKHCQSCYSVTSKLSESIQSENQVGMIEDLNWSESTESSTFKKRPKKESHPKPTKRQKMYVDDETTNSKMIILGVKCPQSECDMMLGTISELHQHQMSVHGVLQYPCLVAGCSEQFENGRKIGYHLSIVHPHQSWVCSKCDIKFANQSKLRTHIREFHQYGHFQCGYAECSFEADLRSKVGKHYKSSHVRYSCPIGGCDFVAYYESSLKEHKQTLHAAIREESNQSDVNQTEPTTSVEVDSKKRIMNRMIDVDDENVKKKIVILGLKCPQSECNLMLESLDQLHRHQEDAHGVLAFSCLVAGCSEQFSIRSSNQIGHHYSTVHPHHTDWICSQCNAKMKNATLLRRHIRHHHQLGQFHCAYLVCNFEADLRSKVRNHLKNAHSCRHI